jgi:hypothetical protein
VRTRAHEYTSNKIGAVHAFCAPILVVLLLVCSCGVQSDDRELACFRVVVAMEGSGEVEGDHAENLVAVVVSVEFVATELAVTRRTLLGKNGSR